MLIALEATDVYPTAANNSVRFPTAPEMDRFVNVATPDGLVVATVVPPSEPPPVRIAAEMSTPASATGLFEPSRSWTCGCGLSWAPVCAVPPGCWVTASLLPLPALNAIGPDVAGVVDPLLNVSV